MRHYIVCILSAFLLFFPLKSYCEITGTSQETSTNPDIVKIYGKDVDISVNSSVSAGTVALPSDYANLPDRYRSSADLENPDSMQHAIDAYRQDQITDKLPLVIINTTIALLLAYYIGNKRQIGFGWSLFFFLFAPILFGLIVVLLSKKIDEPPLPASKIKYIIGWILMLFFSLTGLGNLYLLMRDGVHVYRILGLSGAIWSVGLGFYLVRIGKSIDINNWVSKKNSTENVFGTKKPSNKELLDDQFIIQKKLLNKAKLDGHITEDEYHDKIKLLDIQEGKYREHKNAVIRSEEINKRVKPTLDEYDNLLKNGLFAQSEYEQKRKKLYERIAVELDYLMNLKIGDCYCGGIIFFIDETGMHGKVVAKDELTKSEFLDWKDAQAKCDKLILIDGGIEYNGWRLPTKEEVTHLYDKLDDIKASFCGKEYYWTSSVGEGNSPIGFNFNEGKQLRNRTKLYNGRVRPVRSF